MMDSFSLYSSMRQHGTLSEEANEVSDVVFALRATIHWIRSLAILADDQNLDFCAARQFYENTQKREVTEKELNSICEQLLFSLNQIASLKALTAIENQADIARVGIVTWYYGIYGASSAMIAAADGSFQDNHAATARQWQNLFPSQKLAMPPFSDQLTSLVDANMKDELSEVRKRGKHPLTTKPNTTEQAWGCVAEYLSGTAKWERWNIKERVKKSEGFKALNVSNFKTKSARELRDNAFEKKGISFLHEASRYRGKANYRDAIYLAYGKTVSLKLNGFTADLFKVLVSFSSMSAGYIYRRIGRDLWQRFIADIDENRAISLSPVDIWKDV